MPAVTDNHDGMGNAIDPEISDLLARLYAGIDGPQPWQAFLEALARWMESTYATLIITAPGQSQPGTFVTPGADPQFHDDYITSFFADDAFRDLPEGQVTSLAQFLSTRPNALLPGYREYLKLSGGEQVLGVDLRFGAGKRGQFEARFRLSRDQSLPDFTATDRTRLQALVPHLRIAVGLFEKLQFAGAQHGVFHSTAQGLGLALVVLDRARRIVSTNALAERFLHEGEGVLRHGDEIAFTATANRRIVDELLSASPAAPTGALDTVASVTRFRIERPVHGDLVATARPLDLPAIHSGTGALALFLARPAEKSAPDPQVLRDVLGLTMAEARLTSVLNRGLTLVEAARELGIAHNTAKVQLRSVFAKTGVHRQAQLVALLATLSG
jgi:DNA-binding CsgD family transcriptional regulator